LAGRREGLGEVAAGREIAAPAGRSRQDGRPLQREARGHDCAARVAQHQRQEDPPPLAAHQALGDGRLVGPRHHPTGLDRHLARLQSLLGDQDRGDRGDRRSLGDLRRAARVGQVSRRRGRGECGRPDEQQRGAGEQAEDKNASFHGWASQAQATICGSASRGGQWGSCVAPGGGQSGRMSKSRLMTIVTIIGRIREFVKRVPLVWVGGSGD
jgi:hypothetical protein